MCVCVWEKVRHAHEDVVQYCYDVMQWRWFYVSIRLKTVFIKFALTALYAPGISETRTASKSKRTPRFSEHVFVFTYNLFWIIRVKVEVLMEVTIHIYCLFISAHSLLFRLEVEPLKPVSDKYQFFLFLIYYLFMNCHRFHLQVCIFLFLFLFCFFHIWRALGSRPGML